MTISMQRMTFGVLAVVLVGSLLASAPVEAQTADGQTAAGQVAERDSLIAAQENLLNTYRCMFGVDTAAVSGGCPDPDRIQPGAAPQNPSQQDIDARDSLIDAQETLLNTYRCQHNIDTQLVPGGCDGETAETAETATGFTAISVGGGHSCGIRADQTIACWGLNHDRQSVAPAGQFTAISVAFRHSCAIRADQTIACWGWNDDGQSDAPAGQFTAIFADSGHACAIRADQTIACWGRNNDGQSDAPAGQFTTITSGGNHACAIRADQTIACWGKNGPDQAYAPAGQFTAIAKGRHWCGIRADQTLACWASKHYGQVYAPAGQFTAIATSLGSWCAIRADQTIACWGNNDDGHADAPAGQFTAIAGSCGIRADQTLACWGKNGPSRVDAPAGEFTAISADGGHACAIRADQTLACWGNNHYGQLDPPCDCSQTGVSQTAPNTGPEPGQSQISNADIPTQAKHLSVQLGDLRYNVLEAVVIAFSDIYGCLDGSVCSWTSSTMDVNRYASIIENMIDVYGRHYPGEVLVPIIFQWGDIVDELQTLINTFSGIAGGYSTPSAADFAELKSQSSGLLNSLSGDIFNQIEDAVDQVEVLEVPENALRSVRQAVDNARSRISEVLRLLG